MTTVEADIRTRLLADTDVAALVGARVFPLIAPQNATLPYLVYNRISTRRLLSMAGPRDLHQPRIQIDAWSESYSEVKDLGDKIRLALNGFEGIIGTTTVDLVFLEAEIDDIDRPQDASEQGTYRLSQDFLVWARETV